MKLGEPLTAIGQALEKACLDDSHEQGPPGLDFSITGPEVAIETPYRCFCRPGYCCQMHRALSLLAEPRH